MSIIGIAIDPWKAEIFKEELEADKFDWEEEKLENVRALFLKVKTDDGEKLAQTVARAESRCARNKLN